uniref:Uncharacterized protein n=1 Tax=Musa acuminata subsp. malaccensis TaxID=214687 RepID=A0A804JWE7_MUSAM|nr:PREDICTED: uncharacterized protein LOC103991997 [Musa acuminata subsp. malaccensis]
MVDTGSSTDILYFDAFQKLGLARENMKPMCSALTEFTGDSISPLGAITLPLTLGTPPRSKMVMTTFLVVDLPTAYNAILGRPTLNKVRAVVSTYYQTIKFLTHAGVEEVTGSPRESRRCYLTAVSLHKKAKIEPPLEDPRETKKPAPHPELRGSAVDIPLHKAWPDQTVKVGSELAEREREQLVGLLWENADIFTWSPSDMTGVDPGVAQHHLNIPPDARPVKQKPKRQAPDRQRAIREEVGQLLAAGFIEEARYPQCLNNACPKDCYPLPKIDQLVDATARHARLSFMDAYSGYNQIRMAPEDREHTAFLTDQGVYFYKVMTFGLKNAGATYQRTVNKMFAHQIGRNMEVYVDDMIVKSQEAGAHLADLTEAFATLRKFGMRLNPIECAFGITSGKFLGFIIHERGIDANPEKVRAIIDMQSPRTIKDLQRLNGRLVALSRFLARSSDHCLPFFRALKNPKNFQWTTECEEAFKQTKQHLAGLPRLASVSPGEKLGLYLAASRHVVSSVLIKESSGEQLPIYYVSHVLSGPEGCYPPIEKLALALVLSARKLRPYFQAHPVEVITDQPLRQVAAIRILTDSQLMVEQLIGGYEARDPTMAKYLARVRDLTAKFPYFTLSNVPREENERADVLAKLASKPTPEAWPEVEELPARAVEVVATAPGSAPITWVQELLCFKRDGTLPHDEVAARRLRRTHAWYTEESGRLYKQSFTYPLLRCLEPDEA